MTPTPCPDCGLSVYVVENPHTGWTRRLDAQEDAGGSWAFIQGGFMARPTAWALRDAYPTYRGHVCAVDVGQEVAF